MLSEIRPLRIGIDAAILGKQKGGVEVSVETLIRGLALKNSPHQFFLYLGQGHPFQPNELPPNFHLRLQPTAAPWAGRLAWLPFFYLRDRLDVIYMQRVAAFWGCSRTVLHIHDAMYATHAHLFSPAKRKLLNWLFTWSARKAAAVVTPTRASALDVCHHYRISPDKVTLIPDTVDTRHLFVESNPNAIASVLAHFQIPQPYVIYLGAMERNKNVHGLIDAFHLFHRRNPEFHLVLVGKWRAETKAGYAAELSHQIESLGLNNFVHRTGFVSQEQKRLLLNGASLLVFPSESEGLGLPPIEAMACGVPVIAGAVPAIEEFYGDSLLTCPHNDVSRLAELMETVVRDPVLKNSLIQKGLARASRDSWDAKIPIMLQLLENTARQGESPTSR